MKVRSKLILRNVRQQHVGNGNARRYDGVLMGRGDNQSLHGRVIRGEFSQFLTNVPGPVDTIVLGDRPRRAREQFEQRQLVRYRRETMKLYESQRQKARG